MSTIRPLSLYQIETFGTGIGRHSRQNGRDTRIMPEVESEERPVIAKPVPARSNGFITQLLVDGDVDLRKKLGRHDVAGQRESAYGASLANRPSARPLSFLRVIGRA